MARKQRCGSCWGAAALIAGLVVGLSAGPARAEEAGQSLDKSLSGIKFGVLAYVDYSAGSDALPGGEQEHYNEFSINRGYFTVRKALNDHLGMRVTLDVKQEERAPGTSLSGSYVVRLKYYYLEFKPEDLGFFTNMAAQVGMGHMPWLDFEQSNHNFYRCQGTMPVERAGTFNSADLGISLRGNFGGRIDNYKELTGNRKYDGRYGSWHVGVYNGGGYSAVENNQNKVVEGRVSLRPLAELLPGFQISYFGLYGEGNQAKGAVVSGIPLEEIPDYQVNLYMVSFEHPAISANYQFFTTRGNSAGTWIAPNGKALDTQGWSAFLRLAVPGSENRLNLFGRYDYFDIDPDDKWAKDTAYTMIIAGLSYDLFKDNLLLLVWESTDYENDANVKRRLPVADNDLGDEQKFQVVWQIKF